MTHLFRATAAIEAGAGIALLIAPVVVVQLLLGADIMGAAVPLARVTGAALLTLGLACWLAPVDTGSRAARGLSFAMLVYNIAVAVVLAAAALQSHFVGIALWPAVGLHTGMALWCLAHLVGRPSRGERDH